jgi:hypothetical protein
VTHITDAMLLDVIGPLPTTFDSHAVIRGLMTIYPQEYVREEYTNVSNPDPIRETHRQIGIVLLGVPSIRPTRKVNSPNVRGPITENQKWEKIATAAGV